MFAGLTEALSSRKKFIDSTYTKSAIATGENQIKQSVIDNSTGRFKEPIVDISPTGFRGLFNQGATCYLSTFLQSLYMTPEFRLAIFQYRPKTKNDENYNYTDYKTKNEILFNSNAILQFQSLFISLQLSSNGACSTRYLTNSFGWASEGRCNSQCKCLS